jgi:hypothetical protein
MPEVSKATRIQELAKRRVTGSLALTKRNYANIPLGEKKVDPRTKKKREEAAKSEAGLDTTLSRMLYEMRSKQQ